MSYKQKRRWIAYALIGVFLLFTWLFTGIVYSYADEEWKSSFFLKKYPSFKIRVYNLDDSDSDYILFPALSPEARDVVADYCKYRFGVTEVSKMEACRQNTRTVGVDSGQ